MKPTGITNGRGTMYSTECTIETASGAFCGRPTMRDLLALAVDPRRFPLPMHPGWTHMPSEQRNGSTRRHRQWAARVLRYATTCALCGCPLDRDLKYPDPMSPSADHIEPWAHAPHLRYDPANGQAAHLVCNQRRGANRTAKGVAPPSRQW